MSIGVWAERKFGDEATLTVDRVSKRFPGVQALTDVSIDLRAGEVLGLVGENGAGKSTLIKIIAGVEKADSGEIRFWGRSASERVSGIAVIYQELTVVPSMSAVSNVFLGSPPRRGFWLDTRAMKQKFRSLSGLLGVSIDAGARAGALSIAQQQLLEIMRALVADHRILIMDEPTASLGEEERKHLYAVVGELRRRGTSIIYISHDLEEVLALCDRIAVMRDGRIMHFGNAVDWSKDSLVKAMVGGDYRASPVVRGCTSSEMVLEARDIRLTSHSPAMSFDLHKGEILGIAGLVGAGRTELLRALFGSNKEASGTLRLRGRMMSLPRSVRAAIDEGIALVPEDRKMQGLVLGLSGTENITLADLAATATAGIVRRPQQRRAAERQATKLGLSPRQLDVAAKTLSGGNQQKLVIGKWLHRRPVILLLDEPTRGIDVGAKAEVFETIAKLADEGMSVIMVSSELEELLANCDRILVMARNRLLGECLAKEASIERILASIFEVERAAA